MGDCTAPVEDPDVPCAECRALLGPHLRRVPELEAAAVPAPAALLAGPTRVSRILGEQPAPAPAPAVPAQKRQETCWCCENSRMCTPDPDYPQKWICRSCRQIGA